MSKKMDRSGKNPGGEVHSSSTREVPQHGEVPRHVAIIMDGNGRWAKQRHLPRFAGHKRGVEAVRRVPAQSRGLAMGAYTAFLDLAQGIASPALGLIATGARLNVVFLASAVTVVSAALVALWLMAHPATLEGSPQ